MRDILARRKRQMDHITTANYIFITLKVLEWKSLLIQKYKELELKLILFSMKEVEELMKYFLVLEKENSQVGFIYGKLLIPWKKQSKGTIKEARYKKSKLKENEHEELIRLDKEFLDQLKKTFHLTKGKYVNSLSPHCNKKDNIHSTNDFNFKNILIITGGGA